jgi:hypothetical protein
MAALAEVVQGLREAGDLRRVRCEWSSKDRSRSSRSSAHAVSAQTPCGAVPPRLRSGFPPTMISSWAAVSYLLRSPANARRLLASIDERTTSHM